MLARATIYVAVVDCHSWEIGCDAHSSLEIMLEQQNVSFLSFLNIFFILDIRHILPIVLARDIYIAGNCKCVFFFQNKSLIQKESLSLSGSNENHKRRYFKYRIILDNVYNLCLKLHLFKKNIKVSSLIN